MGRLDYQTDNDNDYTESLFERNEDVSEYTADDRNDDAKMLEDEKGLDTKTYLK